jgi:hypothetical protein
MPWRVTSRSGPRVTRERFEDLDQALQALESCAQGLANEAPGRPVDVKFRRFEPSEVVIGRLELAGPERLAPSVRGGVDVRADGSVQAFLGRVRRQVVEPGQGQDGYGALAGAVRAKLS